MNAFKVCHRIHLKCGYYMDDKMQGLLINLDLNLRKGT